MNQTIFAIGLSVVLHIMVLYFAANPVRLLNNPEDFTIMSASIEYIQAPKATSVLGKHKIRVRHSKNDAKHSGELDAKHQTILEEIRHDIISSWLLPVGSWGKIASQVQVKFNHEGNIVDVHILSSSGNEVFDRSVLQSIYRVRRFAYINNIDKDIFQKYFKEIYFTFRP